MKKILLGLLLIVMCLGANQVWSEPLETLLAITETPIPARDPLDLAARFQNVDLATLSIAPRRDYTVGDRETFTIPSALDRQSEQVNMILAAKTDELYIWVDDAFVPYNTGQVNDLANYISERVLPRIRTTFGAETPISSDSRIYVFTVRNSGTGLLGFFSDTDRFPNEVFPTSNEVNSFVMTIRPLSVESYVSVFAHEFQHLVQAGLDDNEETWFMEGFAELGSLLAAPEFYGSVGRQDAYVENSTANQLNRWAYPNESTDPYYAGGALFLTYITQRAGEAWIPLVAAEPRDGLAGIEQALLNVGFTDSSNQPISVNALFGDFAVTNWLNDASMDSRYGYTLVPVTKHAQPTATYSAYPVQILDGQVNQYGTLYYQLENFQKLNLQFSGQETTRLLPTQTQSGQHFMWSQRGNQGDARLIGNFDLRNISSATLQFKTWFDLEEFWDYAYLSISTNNGASWQILSTPNMTSEDPNDRAFGMGYTGISGGLGMRPAALIGFNFQAGTLAIESIMPNTPASQMGLAVGDEVVAINDQALTLNNFFQVFDQYRPQETIVLRVTRNGHFLDLPILLAEHPSRTVQEPIQWIEQSIDLTPYVGNEILLSFDYVTDQSTSLDGWLLEDMAIPEISFYDDFETVQPVWDSRGWVRISNEIPQEYLVQLIQIQDGKPLVTHILNPDDPNQPNTYGWTIEGGAPAVLAISGIAEVSQLPASFTLEISESD